MNKRLSNENGFSLIELMIIVVIIGIITSMAVPRFQDAYDRIKFRSANRDIISTIRLARSQAIVEKKNIGVNFDNMGNTITLFEKNDPYTVLELFEEADEVIRVDTMPGQYAYVWTDILNYSIVFRPTGQAVFSGGGNIYTLAQSDNVVSVYMINVLASTGRVKNTWSYYYSY